MAGSEVSDRRPLLNRLRLLAAGAGLLAAAALSGLPSPATLTEATVQAPPPNSVTIIKDAVPDDLPDFQFTSGPVADQCPPAGFLLDDDGSLDGGDDTLLDSATFPLTAGCNTVNIFREIVPTGWVLTNIACTVSPISGGTVPVTTVTIGPGGGPAFDPGDTEVSFDLAVEEAVTCTFTNGRVLSEGGWGDDNCDGATNAGDVLFALRQVGGLPANQGEPCPDTGLSLEHVLDGSEVSLRWGDFDCNGSVDAFDALGNLRQLAGFTITRTGPCAPDPPGSQSKEVDWVIICDINEFGQEVNCVICLFIDGGDAGCHPFGAHSPNEAAGGLSAPQVET